MGNNLMESLNLEDDYVKEINKFFSDIGWFPPTWNIKQIILACIKSEACVCNVYKEFLITDISNENILSILNAVDYDLRFLLKLCFELDDQTQVIEENRWRKEELKEENERLDLEWEQDNGSEACDNCGCPTGRNHDCNSAIEGWESDNYEDEVHISKSVGVDYFISKIIYKFESMKERIKDSFEEKSIHTHIRS